MIANPPYRQPQPISAINSIKPVINAIKDTDRSLSFALLYSVLLIDKIKSNYSLA